MPGRKKRSWQESYQALVDYKVKFGTAHVPQLFKDDVPLGQWVNQQRSKKETLHKHQFNALDAIGFEWNPREARWNEMLERLREYKELHDGSTTVPQNYAADPALARWVHKQRTTAFSGSLVVPANRKAKLDAIQFNDTPNFKRSNGLYKNDEKWLTNYARLLAFYKDKGHSRVPQHYPADPTLGRWVMVQRRFQAQNNHLSQKRKDLLEQVEFVWNQKSQRSEDTWKRMCAELEAHRRLHNGSMEVSSSGKDGNVKLATWILHQRKAFQSGTLATERQTVLDTLGFQWWDGGDANDYSSKKRNACNDSASNGSSNKDKGPPPLRLTTMTLPTAGSNNKNDNNNSGVDEENEETESDCSSVDRALGRKRQRVRVEPKEVELSLTI